jgi:broad specificity phosphatase PhoE
MNKLTKQVTVIAVRHAESEHNVLGMINGDPKKKFHITSKGKKQAAALVKKLKNRGIDEIFASQMLRTQETARPLAKYKNVRLQVDKRLNDIHAGKLEGINILEFRKLTHNADKSVNGSETIKQISKRIKSFILDLQKKYNGQTVVVVSSEIILHALKQIAAGKQPNENKGKLLSNALVYSFKIKSDKLS